MFLFKYFFFFHTSSSIGTYALIKYVIIYSDNSAKLLPDPTQPHCQLGLYKQTVLNLAYNA